MKLTIEFDTDNSAFRDNFINDVDRVAVYNCIERHINKAKIHFLMGEDIENMPVKELNGNIVGRLNIKI